MPPCRVYGDPIGDISTLTKTFFIISLLCPRTLVVASTLPLLPNRSLLLHPFPLHFLPSRVEFVTPSLHFEDYLIPREETRAWILNFYRVGVPINLISCAPSLVTGSCQLSKPLYTITTHISFLKAPDYSFCQPWLLP